MHSLGRHYLVYALLAGDSTLLISMNQNIDNLASGKLHLSIDVPWCSENVDSLA